MGQALISENKFTTSTRPERSSTFGGGPQTILLVENCQDQSMVTVGLLGRSWPDASVARAQTLGDAIATVETSREPFGIIVLGLGLPDSSGVDAVARLRQSAPEIPIVVLTADGEEVLGPACVRLGASDFIPKTYLSADRLVQAVERCASLEKLTVPPELNSEVSQLRFRCATTNLMQQFGQSYEKLLTMKYPPNSAQHRVLIRELGRARATGADVAALHAHSLKATSAKRQKGLADSQAMLIESLIGLSDYYRMVARIPTGRQKAPLHSAQ